MKLVYVLICDEKDFYFENALVSIFSARHNCPNAYIEIVTDKVSACYLNGRWQMIGPLVNKLTIVETPVNLSKKQSSRYIKTNLRNLVTGDFLYLDVDTIVLKEIKESDLNCKTDIGAVRHAHIKVSHGQNLKDYLRVTGKEPWKMDVYYNGGVIYVKDTERAYKFYDDWHGIWTDDFKKFGIEIDQPSMSQAIAKNEGLVSELKEEFNCQAECTYSKPFYFNPFIFHYYAELGEDFIFPLKKENFLKKIRTEGIIDEIKKVISNPQSYYFKSWKFVPEGDIEFFNSKMYRIARKIYNLSKDNRKKPVSSGK